MAYSATNWVDGTTPVNASNLNKLEGGVSDLSDAIDEITSTGILSKKVVSSSSNSVYIMSFSINSGESQLISYSTSAVLIYFTSDSSYGITMGKSNGMAQLVSAGSVIEVTRSNSSLTVANNSSTALRGLAIVN